MKHLAPASMILVAGLALFGMVSIVTAAVKPAPLTQPMAPPIALTQSVDSDKDPVETVLVLGVYPANDASKVEYFTYNKLFPNRFSCQQHQEDMDFKRALVGFLHQKMLDMGVEIGYSVTCRARGAPA